MIAIIDYGAGNIFSVKNAMDHLGIDARLTNDKGEIEAARGIILPGVGAFPWAMGKLRDSGLIDVIKAEAKKKPFLGICLGMQLLFEKSFEFEECEGLGLIKGYVDKIPDEGLVIPHMGWNKLEMGKAECGLLNGFSGEEYVYFVHSYKAFCEDDNLCAYCEYGGKVPALVSDGNTVFGAQFHPEKSGEAGLRILRNFVEMTGRYFEWDDENFKIPEKFLLGDNSTLGEAVNVFYEAGGYDFFNVSDPKHYGLKWLEFMGNLYSDIEDGKYKSDGKTYSIPLSAEKIRELASRGVSDIFTRS